jgi:hypothetical protein
MKNFWLQKREERSKLTIAGSGLKVRVRAEEVDDFYPIGMGAGTCIVLKDGRKYTVRESPQIVSDKLDMD